jgi:UPF0755 protein
MAGPPRRGLGARRAIGALALGLVVVVLVAGAWWAIGRVLGDPPAAPGDPVAVTIPPGSSATAIGGILADAGVVPDAGAFVDRAVEDGYESTFRPGSYTFREDEEYARIVDQLNAGPADADDARLVIPEGYAIWNIEEEVAAVGITPEQYQAALDRHEPPPGFLAPGEEAASLEGFLFPATYDVAVPADADGLVRDQLAAFEANVAGVDFSYAESKGLTKYDVLKIASLIERETAHPPERPKVAAIIYNRLASDMTTGMESGIQYALGSWEPLTRDDLDTDSPYNLWIEKGLPPTPIANPGLDSIKAAANPARVDFLYMYAIKDDPKRRHFFTDDYDEFLRYQEENPYW